MYWRDTGDRHPQFWPPNTTTAPFNRTPRRGNNPIINPQLLNLKLERDVVRRIHPYYRDPGSQHGRVLKVVTLPFLVNLSSKHREALPFITTTTTTFSPVIFFQCRGFLFVEGARGPLSQEFMHVLGFSEPL